MFEQLLTTRDVLYAFGRKPYDDGNNPIPTSVVPAPTGPLRKCDNPPETDQPPLT